MSTTPDKAEENEEEEPEEPRSSSFWLASLVWVLLLLIVYFGADIIDKGVALNQLTPWPVLGYLLWGVIVLAIWQLLLQPLLQFWNLRRAGKESLRKQVKRARNNLKACRKGPKNSELRQLAEEFAAADHSYSTTEGKDAWTELLARYREALHAKAHSAILGYCKAAGIGVVFSRNNMLDGLILLAMQVRLAIALAKLYGYKPSPVFNTCCLGWIAANSLVAALAHGALDDLGETATDMMLELVLGSDEMASAGAELVATKAGMQLTISIIIEAIMAGTAVYITGRLFLWKLESDGREVSLKTMLQLRAEGRRELAGNLLRKTPAAVAKTAGSLATGTVSAVGDKIKGLFGHSRREEPAPSGQPRP